MSRKIAPGIAVRRRCSLISLCIPFALLQCAHADLLQPKIYDAFGRDITNSGLTLIDWDGYVANPIFQYTVVFEEAHAGILQVTSVSPMFNYWPSQPCPNSSSCMSADDDGVFTQTYYTNASTTECETAWQYGASTPESMQALQCANGPKTFTLGVGWMPDRDSGSSSSVLHFTWEDLETPPNLLAEFTLPVQVIDLDDLDSAQTEDFIKVDWSANTAPFFDASHPDGAVARATVEQAAADWSFFIDSSVMLDHAHGVPLTLPHLQTDVFELSYTAIANCDGQMFPSVGCNWNPVYAEPAENADQYRGFNLYAFGVSNTHHDPINSPCLRSTGQPTNSIANMQGLDLSVDGDLFRSGMLAIETAGNYCANGYSLSSAADLWRYAARCNGCSHLPGQPPPGMLSSTTDLYSIAHHEMGHSIAFDWAYPNFCDQKCAGDLCKGDPPGFGSGTQEYWHKGLGSHPGLHVVANASDHLNLHKPDGLCVAYYPIPVLDPASQRGAFGNEQEGNVLSTRWMITKLDLHVLEAVGYVTRKIGPLEEFTASGVEQIQGQVGEQYEYPAVFAQGGMGVFRFEVINGALPGGISLDSFTGDLTGVPQEAGTYAFTVLVTEYPLPGQDLADAAIVEIETQLMIVSEACKADFDGSGEVDIHDLLYVINFWGDPICDLDGDGDSDVGDLLLLLDAWGTECSSG